jgi:hypothetical protein
MDDGFEYDSLCMLTGLMGKQELNGRCIRVCSAHPPPQEGRVPCELMIGEKRIAVKPENLRKLPNARALMEPDVQEAMPNEDMEDARLYFHAMEGSTQIAPGVTLMDCSGRA